jgi:hypothetical protein
MKIQQYIERIFADGLSYEEAAQLCLRLYITVDGIPDVFHEQCSKDGLAEAFAGLAAKGLVKGGASLATIYGANFHAIHEKGHWIEVIASIFKEGGLVDMDVGDRLVKRLTEARPLIRG